MPLLPFHRPGAPRADVEAAARLRLQRLLQPAPGSADGAADVRPRNAGNADGGLVVPPARDAAEADPAADANPTWTRWRLDPSGRGAGALAGLAALSIAVTAAYAWTSRPEPVRVPPPVVTATSAGATVVVVDVQGDVRRPGLVSVPAGARVADAIAAAGGLKPGASTLGLNLARRVADGEQVLVAPPGAPARAGAPAAPAAVAGSAGSRLDLNLATLEQLDALPGVGPVTARRIMEWRTQHGRFASVDQLREVDGIGDKRFDSLRELVTV